MINVSGGEYEALKNGNKKAELGPGGARHRAGYRQGLE
jgi:hypothetical protein